MHILNILHYTPEQYERILFETWLAYADIISFNEIDLQKILANTAYFNWFLQEHNRLEQLFMSDIQVYLGKIDIETIRDFYDDYTCQVAKHYPKPLLKAARKLSIVNHQFN